jgi:hypothetical protein
MVVEWLSIVSVNFHKVSVAMQICIGILTVSPLLLRRQPIDTDVQKFKTQSDNHNHNKQQR